MAYVAHVWISKTDVRYLILLIWQDIYEEKKENFIGYERSFILGSLNPDSIMKSKYIYSLLFIVFLLMWHPNYWRKKEKDKTWFLDKASSLRALQCPKNQEDSRCGGGVESMDLVMEEK